MVDAAASAETTGSDHHSGDMTPVVLSGPSALDTYRLLCADAVHAPPQSGPWIASWVQNCGPDFIVATLQAEGRPVFALALEIVSRGPFRIAAFCGGPHANGNFPAATPSYLASPQPAQLAALMREIRTVRPDIDLVLLERQLPLLDDFTNPFVQLPRLPSPNIALAAELHGGFEALLARKNGSRKRGQHRRRARKFEAAGGFRVLEASNPAEVDRFLTEFFAMKEERFQQMGIEDVFAPTEVRAFFRGLFTEALGASPSTFTLRALEVAGNIRAVTGLSRSGNRIVLDITGFANDEFAQHGPGDFLLFEIISGACDEGFAVFDFSVGDERYKRSWSNIETEHFDSVLPLTAKGYVLAAAIRGMSGAKRLVKRNPMLWRIAKRLRTFRGGLNAESKNE